LALFINLNLSCNYIFISMSLKNSFFLLFAISFGNLNHSYSQEIHIQADTNLIQIFQSKGDSCFTISDYKNSIQFYNRAESIVIKSFSESNDTSFLIRYLTLNRFIAYNYNCLGNFEKAFVILEYSIGLAHQYLSENNPVFINLFRNLGNTYLSVESYDSAYYYLKKSIDLASFQVQVDKIVLANACNDFGNILDYNRRYAEALEYKNKALDIRRKLNPVNQESISASFSDIAKTYQLIGNYDTSQVLFFKSLDLIQNTQFGKSPEVISVYNNIGVNYYYKGDFQKSLEYYKKATDLTLKVFEPNHVLLIHSYNNMGSVYIAMGEYNIAVGYLKKAEDIFDNNPGAGINIIADVYNNLGVAYYSLSKYNDAIVYYIRSNQIRTRQSIFSVVNVARTFDNIGTSFLSLNKTDSAMKYYRQAMELRKGSETAGFSDRSSSYINLGNAYQLKGVIDSAMWFYQKALSHLSGMGRKHPDISLCYNNLGMLYQSQRKWKESLTCFQKAISANISDFDDSISFFSNPTGYTYYSGKELMVSLANKAISLSQLYYQYDSAEYAKSALATFSLCDSFIDNLRFSFLAANDRILLGKQTSIVYGEAVNLCYSLWSADSSDLSLFEKALYYSEKNKNATLLMSLSEIKAKGLAGISDSISAEEQKIILKKTYYETKIKELLLSGGDLSKIKEFEEYYFDLELKETGLKKIIKEKFPKYYNIRYSAGLLNLRNIRALLDTSKATIEYFIAKDKMFCFVITSKYARIVKSKMDSATLEILKTYNDNICNDDFDQFVRNSKILYKILIDPITNCIDKRITNLQIVPDGQLSLVPFETLVNNKGNAAGVDFRRLNYLIKKFEISYCSSLILLISSRDHVMNKTPKTIDFTGFAPRFPDALQIEGKLFNNLPFAFLETRMIGDLFINHGNHVQLFLNEDANELNFKEHLIGSKYIHIATHGYVNNMEPSLSFLLFSIPGKRQTRENQHPIAVNNPEDSALSDNILYANEMYNLKIDAELLVLSACETGAGAMMRGEGVMSMTRGFIYSGARNILNTYWQINDATTQKLMVDFYKGIIENMTYSQALRSAKINLINNVSTSFPHSWAGYILTGN
jgi:CHAT domain-containing protein/Tfp pilus assembly protein PilF